MALIAALARNPVPKRHDGFALKPFGVVVAHIDGLLPLLRSAPITLVNGVLSDSDRKTAFGEKWPAARIHAVNVMTALVKGLSKSRSPTAHGARLCEL